MRTLDFIVQEQSLIRQGDFSKIIKGSKGYLQCKFDFSQEWTTYQVAAIFEYRDTTRLVQVTDSMCDVPDEVTDGLYFTLRLLGVKDTDHYFYTEKLLIEQED